MNSDKKLVALAEIAEKIAVCRDCRLCEQRTKVVPGAGDPDAEILFIGEAPGKAEDASGVPFVGAAGKFLDKMLESIGLARENIFIANVVKCRPPGNRDPAPEEAEKCWHFLEKQIEIIQPKLIATLGRHSMNRFFAGAADLGGARKTGAPKKRTSFFAAVPPRRGTLFAEFERNSPRRFC